MFSTRSSMIFYNKLQQHNWIRKMMQKDLMIDDNKWSEIIITMKKKMISSKIYDIKLDSELTKRKLQMMIAKIIVIFNKEIESISQNWLHKTLMIMTQQLNNNKRRRAQHWEQTHENIQYQRKLQKEIKDDNADQLSLMSWNVTTLLTIKKSDNQTSLMSSIHLIMNKRQEEINLLNMQFEEYKRLLIEKRIYDMMKNRILYDSENMRRIEIENERCWQTALIEMTAKSCCRFQFIINRLSSDQ